MATPPALDGLAVVELTSGLDGAYCGRLLALLGAAVVKVESPSRPDEARRAATGVDRFLHAQKRSVAVDLTHARIFVSAGSSIAEFAITNAGTGSVVSSAATLTYLGSFGGSGGTLIDPKRDGTAFVLFHDLKPAPAGTRYTIWMIRPDSSWVRAVNFVPSGETLQRVDVPLVVSDFAQCAVTVETRDSGAPQGTLAMQSRVFAQ